MEAAQKEGKSSPSNEWMFNNGVNDFLNDGDIQSSYNGQFVNKVDYDKQLQDAIHAAHEDKLAEDENVLNADGTVNHDILDHKIKEGLSTSKVISIARSIYSKPEVQQQLMMDGLYKYKDATPEQLYQERASSARLQKEQIFMADPKLRAYSLLGDAERKAKANRDLEYNYQYINSIDGELANFRKSIVNNFDGAKVSAFTEDKLIEQGNNYAWTNISHDYKVSPWFTVNIEKSKFALQQKQFNEQLNMDSWSIKEKQAQIAHMQFEDLVAAQKASGKLDANGNPIFMPGLPETIVGNEAIGAKSFQKNLDDINIEKNNVFANVISGIGVTVPTSDGKSKQVFDLYIRDATNQYVINPKYQDASTGTFTQDGKQIYDAAQQQLKSKIDAVGHLHLTGSLDKAFAGDIQRYWDLNTKYDAYKAKAADIEKRHPGAKEYDDLMDAQQKEVERLARAGGGGIAQLATRATQWIDNHILGGTSKLDADAQARNAEYADIQRQNKSNTITLSTADPKFRDKMRLDLLAELESQRTTHTGDGWLAKSVEILTKPGIGADGLINNNIYKFKHDDNTGKWYVNIAQGSGSTFSEAGHDIEITPGFAQTWNLKSQLNPKETILNSSVVGSILNLNRGNGTIASTTNDVLDPASYTTALERATIGNYSIGIHYKGKDAGNDSYIPYLYILEKPTGKVYNGVVLDWSKLATLPGLTKLDRQVLSQTPVTIDRLDTPHAFEQFKETINKLSTPELRNQAIKLLIQDQANQ